MFNAGEYKGLDIDKALAAADEHKLWLAHELACERALWIAALRVAEANDDIDGNASARGWLAELPEMTALQALAVDTRLADLLMGRRWSTMRQAREDGCSWAKIGEAIGVSKQAAQEWYYKQIAAAERAVGAPLHDVERSRAVLDD
jgi:hypothetical protein